MGEFVRIVIDENKCGDAGEAESWINICPVGVFELVDGRPQVVEENEDECTFCGLCLDACPNGAITIIKLYDE